MLYLIRMSDEGWKLVSYHNNRHNYKHVPHRGKNVIKNEMCDFQAPPYFPMGKNQKRKPIMSYGIILFTIVEIDGVNTPLYLVSQRRDTVEYVDFIRGQYNTHNSALIEKFIGLMSVEERERMSNYSFEQLWKDLWINRNHKIYTDCFDKAYCKFDLMKSKVPFLLEKSPSNIKEPSWGFPKGKKNSKESPVNCALREFSEETRLDNSSLTLINNQPVVEIYNGSNSKLYGTNYYVAFSSEKLEICRIKTEGGIRTSTVSEELGDVQWLTLAEAQLKLNQKRQKLIGYVDKMIRLKNYV